MNSMWWRFMSIDISLYVFTATSAHLVMSLGQTLFHRHLGHRHFGEIFFRIHVHFHHAHYSGDHIASVHHGKNEGNNTPFFLILIVLVVGLSYLFMRFDLFVVQLAAMSLSFSGMYTLISNIILRDHGLTVSRGSSESSNSILFTTAMLIAISR